MLAVKITLNNIKIRRRVQESHPLLPRIPGAAKFTDKRTEHAGRTYLLLAVSDDGQTMLLAVKNKNNNNKIRRRVQDSPLPSTPHPPRGRIHHQARQARWEGAHTDGC